MSHADAPIACNLEALDTEQRAVHRELGERLLRQVIEWRAPPDALELRLPADAGTLADLGRFMLLEQVCCPFYTLEIRLDRDQRAWLRFTGDREAVRYAHRTNPVAAHKPVTGG